MTDRRNNPEENNVRWSWRGTVPVTVFTGIIQLIGMMYGQYNNSKSTSEVVKQIEAVSHQVEILSIKQSAYEPRFVLIETQVRMLSEQVMGLKKFSAGTEKIEKN